MDGATTIIASGGHPSPVGVLDHLDASNETRMISAGSTLRTRRTPASWGVICLIDQIQREQAILAHIARGEAFFRETTAA